MMNNPNSGGNPYVGPRTFTYDQRHLFFGRQREARDLLALVISQRLVLFYAQSGAGKSSLINTRLAPRLAEEGFTVLPVARVGGSLPPGIDAVNNVFVYNLMLDLDQGGGDPGRLVNVKLPDFLAGLTQPDGHRWVYEAHPATAVAALAPQPAFPVGGDTIAEDEVAPRVLIIDQFEEIFTQPASRRQDREEFFRQLDQAMREDPSLWVVLTLREEYVAALDPYAALMSDKLRARYYMQRLGTKAALDAIRRPAEAAGRPFAPDVAEALVKNLCQMRMPGQEALVEGEYVEPVQLQVVCYQLWEGLAPVAAGQAGEITFEDLAKAGDVDTALTDFYNAAIGRVVATPGLTVTEPELRRWFSTRLITPAGTRGIVFRGETETDGIPNAVIDRLQSEFLLRTEPRAGGEWVELVHDRFIEPILRANQAQQSRLTLDAEAWEASHRSETLLYQGQKLKNAEAELLKHRERFSAIETTFVAVSRRRQTRLQRRMRAGQVVPIISDEALVSMTLGDYAGMVEGYADQVAKYPMPDKNNLFKVANFHQRNYYLSDNELKVDYLNWVKNYIYLTAEAAGRDKGTLDDVEQQWDNLQASTVANRLAYPNLEGGADNPLRVLANLPLRVYVTTSPYTFIEDALKAAGKMPRTDFCRWSKLLDRISSSLPPDYEPSLREPLVYHLHGIDEYPDSLVLTEDDYLEFIVNVAVNQGSPGDRVLPVVRQALIDYLILLGFNPLDWPFRSVYSGLIKLSTQWGEERGVSVLEPPASQEEKLYLESSLRRAAGFTVLWTSIQEYMQELYQLAST